MESFEFFNFKRSNSIIFKNSNNSNFYSKNKEYDNLSFKHKNTQSDSTTTEEKTGNNNIKKSFSQRIIDIPKINFNNVNNFKNEKNIGILSKKSNKTIKNKNSNSKKLIFGEIKEEALKINNDNKIKDDKFKRIDSKMNIIKSLKPFPPGINCLHNYKYGKSEQNIIFNSRILNPKLPNVFINHLLFKNNINSSEDYKNLPISITNRIKSKTLTILYYRPIKNL